MFRTISCIFFPQLTRFKVFSFHNVMRSYQLPDREYVRPGSLVLITTGAPQGTVLNPLVFTLYTSDSAYKSPLWHIKKNSGDTAVVGCVKEGDKKEYRKVISALTHWSRDNGLVLNAAKTKEMDVDFGNPRSQHLLVQIVG